MCSATQRLNPFYCQQIGTDTRNTGSHTVQHGRKLLQIRFTGSIINRCFSFRKHSRHQDIGRTGHRSFIEQHIGSFQLLRLYFVELTVGIITEASPQLLNTDKVSVQTTASDLIASRFRDQCLAKTGDQRADNHHRTAQGTAFTQELVRLKIVQVDSIGLECIGIGRRMFHLHLHIAQELYQVIHIQYIRYIMDCHFFRRKQCCTNDLQGFILCALRYNLTGQPVTAFYDK